MTTEDIIYKNLSFLCDEYGFEYSSYNDYGDYYCFKTLKIEIVIYVWDQFDEREAYITYSQLSERIDMLHYKPKEYGRILQKKKGIKGIFYDEREEYYHLLAQVIREKVDLIILSFITDRLCHK